MRRSGAEVNVKHGLEGRYANHVEIGVSDSEVVLDFGQYFLDTDQPLFHTRIIMTPKDAGALLEILMGALALAGKTSREPGREQ